MSKSRKFLVGGLCVVAILLALLPGVEVWGEPTQWLSWYSPSVAVLTLTLVAVILYAAFTFELVEETREMVKHVGSQTKLLERQVDHDQERLRRDSVEYRASQLERCVELISKLGSARRTLDALDSPILWEGIYEGSNAFVDSHGDNRLQQIVDGWRKELDSRVRPLANKIGPPVVIPVYVFGGNAIGLALELKNVVSGSSDLEDPEAMEAQLRERMEYVSDKLEEAREVTKDHYKTLVSRADQLTPEYTPED